MAKIILVLCIRGAFCRCEFSFQALHYKYDVGSVFLSKYVRFNVCRST